MALNGVLSVDLPSGTSLRQYKTHQQYRELSVPAGVWELIREAEFDVRSAVVSQGVVAD
ncbi:hypothetical protein [Mycobacteroides abscessus]|uniref:hypothetical protein n=1 Tax=Mycobacteroides abscessus TaxID=36809 RepID=UPI00038D9DA4|nr:hypothetical protein [Mycobacteroides abscessus]EPZ18139.1 hypothetical protein M879_22815 [Mycobacteroides abscessus V06705]MDM2702175.1 hypothetical protein [Mycobacteroides abscessus]MDO3265700.1 hypothetical protein [Mycobacteroides abscessus subsp. abscessus]SHV40806.1 Uncharacterised protein [Mycobacteroides abscessus subsp. abscessus]SHX02417.1 Uncharacterised protein [Mycobacteroides abscessus subsp. abscessus]